MKKYGNKIVVLMLVVFMISMMFMGCNSNKVDPREKEVIEFMKKYDYDGAIAKAKELYTGEELEEMLDWINKDIERTKLVQQKIEEYEASKNPSSKLEIQGHTHKISDGYIYVTGRVKNVSDDDISYFEVVCKYLDENGQVLDSDYTNSGLVLKPGEMREFEIMHKYREEYSEYEVLIGDVR